MNFPYCPDSSAIQYQHVFNILWRMSYGVVARVFSAYLISCSTKSGGHLMFFNGCIILSK